MNNYMTKYSILIISLVCFGLLLASGFFIPTENQFNKPDAYIIGATPPVFEMWEMY